MRRLLLLFAGLALTLWGRSILTGDSASPGVLLRDGLLIVLLGVVVFSLNARSPAQLIVGDENSSTSGPRLLLAWAGLAGALIGGIWLAMAFTTSDGGLLLPILLWLGGLAVGVIGLNWPQRGLAAQAPVVWSVEAARRYLQARHAQDTQSQPGLFPLERRTIWVFLFLLTVVGLVLRIWNFADLPGGCRPTECDTALAALGFLRTGSLRDLLLAPFPANTALYALFFALIGTSQNSQGITQ